MPVLERGGGVSPGVKQSGHGGGGAGTGHLPGGVTTPSAGRGRDFGPSPQQCLLHHPRVVLTRHDRHVALDPVWDMGMAEGRRHVLRLKSR